MVYIHADCLVVGGWWLAHRRYNPVLAKHLEEMGGVSYMLLTHR